MKSKDRAILICPAKQLSNFLSKQLTLNMEKYQRKLKEISPAFEFLFKILYRFFLCMLFHASAPTLSNL